MRNRPIRASKEFIDYLEKQREFLKKQGIEIKYPALTRMIAKQLREERQKKPITFKL